MDEIAARLPAEVGAASVRLRAHIQRTRFRLETASARAAAMPPVMQASASPLRADFASVESPADGGIVEG